MAIYHCHFKIISRKSGASVVASVAYRAGEKITSEYDGRITNAIAYRSGEKIGNQQDGKSFDYTNKRGIVHTEILLPKNAPKEYLDRATLWNAVETKEKRRDAQLARECEISLPVELNADEQKELVMEYIQKNFVDKGICADIAIHDKKDGNPHAHVMLTMRDVDENGFGKKRAEEQGINGYMQRHKRIKEWRKEWAGVCNKHLEMRGFSARIDHRTLEAQGIDREPKRYMGLGYKHKKSFELTERFRGEGEPLLNSSEIRKIERQINQLELFKNNLQDTQKKIEVLRQKRIRAKDRIEIDRQIFFLEKSVERDIAEIERKIEQMNRDSIRPPLSGEHPSRGQPDRSDHPARLRPTREHPSREPPSRKRGFLLDLMREI